MFIYLFPPAQYWAVLKKYGSNNFPLAIKYFWFLISCIGVNQTTIIVFPVTLQTFCIFLNVAFTKPQEERSRQRKRGDLWERLTPLLDS